ncbi:hypothetical protein HETIRDRAFT_412378 [Heterobasidion irregulare TC 32-1]|uniref:Uncharacterized protein n=1 Tax=Heterobasidion irregulare (strain TC 32-1) TaxID=747525 RepID=W4JPU4_HETIT|nr:uncharacterized protein HETIRDRAFT_412378 [Heterobasidion irregulare TC 32-1]ETW75105.1 hypothetical protein HETIRDRAFT_412378 [Heterobasidion irregulare TC 32-1]
MTGEGGRYKSRKGLIVHEGYKCQTTRSYNDRGDESTGPRPSPLARAIGCTNRKTGRGQDKREQRLHRDRAKLDIHRSRHLSSPPTLMSVESRDDDEGTNEACSVAEDLDIKSLRADNRQSKRRGNTARKGEDVTVRGERDEPER